MSKLPDIPNKRYFTIGEVSTLCAIKPHVLRYWEQEFTALRPSKRRGNRRYYRLEDVQLVRHIKSLLYDQGYTISGARMQLTSGKPTAPVTPPQVLPSQVTPAQVEEPAVSAPTPASPTPSLVEKLEDVIATLK